MKAFRLTAAHQTQLTTAQQPEPGPGDVLVKVGAAGVCHSDLHIIDAPAGAFPTPMTLGHENAGWVEATGAGVTGGESRRLEKGDVIIVPNGTPHWFKDVSGTVLYYVVKVQ